MPQDEIESTRAHVNKMDTTQWLNHELFSLNWWIIVIFNVVLFALLVFLADRRRTSQIAVSFLIAYAIVGFFDESGEYFGWWSYPYELIPFSARFNAVNFFAIPSIIALVYQWFTRWSSFLLATVVYAAVNSYVGEPIFVMLGIYKLNTWTYTGSFLVMIVIPVLVKYLTDVITHNKDHIEDDSDSTITINGFRRKEKLY